LVGGGPQDLPHLVRRQGRVRRQHEGDHAGDDRGSTVGAADRTFSVWTVPQA